MAAAQTPGWDLSRGPQGEIMATRDSGQIGMPYVVLAAKSGRGLKVSLYQPGDDISVEGEEIGSVAGNPRELGRQLRDLLSDIDLGD
ncbi:MAG: hypothetical protein WCO31_02370 [Actinomycetes bacterium]